MRLVKKLFFFLLISLISFKGFSQTSIDEGIYLSEDKLRIITILPKNEISFIEYNHNSPYSNISKELPKNQFCGTRFYEVLQSGFGKYSINKSNLEINFKANVKPLDSSNVTTLTNLIIEDSIILKFRINSYPENNQENFVYGVDISSNDLKINTTFENEIELKIPKSNNDIKFLINDHYELKVKPETNLVIDLNFNLYKTIITDNLKNKVVDFNSFEKVSR